MIRSFAEDRTASLFLERKSRFWSDVQAVALRKLDQLHAAQIISDLAVPPGNRLEALQGTRAGQHSIRVNQQWRVCFLWQQDGAHAVELVDYH